MRPDRVRVEETAAWVMKARKDLWRAETTLACEPPDTEDCVFHCQQAAEKTLKAFLTWSDRPFRKTHDLIELARQRREAQPSLASALDGLGPLSRYAWEYRYPGEQEAPTEQQARGWATKVAELMRVIESHLPGAALVS
jgi:HEPN domain-containing protein